MNDPCVYRRNTKTFSVVNKFELANKLSIEQMTVYKQARNRSVAYTNTLNFNLNCANIFQKEGFINQLEY